MNSLVLRMHRMTTLHDTVNASGAGEAFVRLLAALRIRPSAEAHRLKEEELLFGSTRSKYDSSVRPYINATDSVKTLLKFIVYRPRAALTHTLRRHGIVVTILSL